MKKGEVNFLNLYVVNYTPTKVGGFSGSLLVINFFLIAVDKLENLWYNIIINNLNRRFQKWKRNYMKNF